MNEIQELHHRIAMIKDDLQIIREHINNQDIADKFMNPTAEADECWTHFTNIEIACDLDSNESLTWKPFNKIVKNELNTHVENLTSLDRHYFWMHRPKVVINELSKHFSKVEDVTYLNDTAPSVEVEGKYLVFLPNSIRSEDEESNQYMICLSEEYGNLMTGTYKQEIVLFDDLDKVIDEIHRLKENDKSLESLLYDLKNQALELLNVGDSHDIREGQGMLKVIAQVENNLEQSKEK